MCFILNNIFNSCSSSTKKSSKKSSPKSLSTSKKSDQYKNSRKTSTNSVYLDDSDIKLNLASHQSSPVCYQEQDLLREKLLPDYFPSKIVSKIGRLLYY